MPITKIEDLFRLNDVIFNYYFLIGGLFLSYLIYRILHTVLDGNNYMQTKYRCPGHTWRSIQCNKSIPYSIHCTICGKLMLPVAGLFCECCAVSSCKRCHWAADKKIKCKQITWPSSSPFYHQWVNVGSIRGENTGQNDEEQIRFFCSWCQRIKRSTYENLNKNQECDFQKYRNIIIPPMCVQLEKGNVKAIKPLDREDWEPLIILANRKSGSNRSDEVLSLFRGLLNPIQLLEMPERQLLGKLPHIKHAHRNSNAAKEQLEVVDISVCSPERVSAWLPARSRVLVAGGDGTVAWVLNAIAQAPHLNAAVGILPMGTGNDLSRVLGWGAGCVTQLDAHHVIAAVCDATPQLLDRWRVTLTPTRSRLGRRRARSLHAYNYASVGVDAQVALDFHRARTQFLYRYASRTLNYIAYAFLGVGRALDAGGCDGLERRMCVRAAGNVLPLPPLQALVALNIPSWGAGVDLWSMGPEGEVGPQSIDDGKLEVVGISSSFHIARLQCGLAEPYRFTQASHLEIVLEGSCAMQVDGEPWMQGPASIVIQPAGQSRVLRARLAQ